MSARPSGKATLETMHSGWEARRVKSWKVECLEYEIQESS